MLIHEPVFYFGDDIFSAQPFNLNSTSSWLNWINFTHSLALIYHSHLKNCFCFIELCADFVQFQFGPNFLTLTTQILQYPITR